MSEYAKRIQEMSDDELRKIIGWRNNKAWLFAFRKALVALIEHLEGYKSDRATVVFNLEKIARDERYPFTQFDREQILAAADELRA